MGNFDGHYFNNRQTDGIKASMKSLSELETVAVDSNRGEINNRRKLCQKHASGSGLHQLFPNEEGG